jgi:hypothetical protein
VIKGDIDTFIENTPVIYCDDCKEDISEQSFTVHRTIYREESYIVHCESCEDAHIAARIAAVEFFTCAYCGVTDAISELSNTLGLSKCVSCYDKHR